ncbi:MAG: hypothetical protein KC657_30085 [Myxococcales bacterium]|nr:hypothetical protein [Myxococcales bacterium]
MWALAVMACGSRTGLFTDEAFGVVTNGSDDATARDGTRPPTTDASFDVAIDALPPIDSSTGVDADRSDCPDADGTFVYVVTAEGELFSFYPPGLTFRSVGPLVCPSTPGETPFSMAVDRRGVAYVLYTDGRLFRVSTATAACTATTYRVNQLGFETFGMGFASEGAGPAERLYVAENNFGPASRGLGTIDTTSFVLSFVGPFVPPIPRAELTGTGDGRLFAFWPERTGPSGSRIAELDKRTGAVVAQSAVPIGRANDAFAFAFWGGDFWIFTSGGALGTEVSRYRPSDGTTTTPTTHPQTVVGAGVSTCAPQL